jgi:uncharacterized protein DUF2877
MTAAGALRARAAGLTACAALARHAGLARVLARPRGAAFVTAGDEVLWLGPLGGPLHPRAVLAAELPDAAVGADIRVDLAGLVPWAPPPLALDAAAVARMRATWRRLADSRATLGEPDGLAALVLERAPAFPLDGVVERVRALADACARDDVAAAEPAALALLGLGAGLTPSGDDFVGGALFARRLLAGAGVLDAGAWGRVADAVGAAARTRTHPISAALLGDLAGGRGHAPLHELAAALAAKDLARARAAAARLVRLGHTSGWDIVAGFSAGLA